MKTAKTIEAVSVSADYQLEGEFWLEVPFQGGYYDYAVLPKALEFEGQAYGQTGWNSDKNLAYYSTGKKFAITANPIS